jgi:uncharacterized membrane protein YgcG
MTRKSRAVATTGSTGAGTRAALRQSAWLTALGVAVVLSILVSIFWERPALVPVPRAPVHYLEDRAGLVSPQFAAAKNQYLDHLSNTMRIAHINVVILPRAPSPELEEFSVRAVTAWKIGTAGVDNGLALFVFKEERMLRLEVGYGLESVITDALASRLLSEVLVPAFARGQYEAGIEDFLDTLNKVLEASEAANRRASPPVEFFATVKTALRHAPGVAREAWRTFVEGDREARFGLTMFGAIIAGLAVYALATIAAAIPAILMLPWRVYASPTLRGASLAGIGEQFSPRNFFARPPPFVIGVFNDLQLGAVVSAFYMVAGLVVGIALLFTGAGLFMDGTGRFSGAGATVPWPALWEPGR